MRSHVKTRLCKTTTAKIYIRITANGAKTDFFHIDRLHEYLHNRRIAGEPNSLKAHWDNIQEFFEILWNKTK